MLLAADRRNRAAYGLSLCPAKGLLAPGWRASGAGLDQSVAGFVVSAASSAARKASRQPVSVTAATPTFSVGLAEFRPPAGADHGLFFISVVLPGQLGSLAGSPTVGGAPASCRVRSKAATADPQLPSAGTISRTMRRVTFRQR
jgi:hypothetical protein